MYIRTQCALAVGVSVNVDKRYLVFNKAFIPNTQLKILNKECDIIKNEAINYIKGYEKVAIKKAENNYFEYRMSSLHNFHKELKIDEKILQKELENDLNINKVKRKENDYGNEI